MKKGYIKNRLLKGLAVICCAAMMVSGLEGTASQKAWAYADVDALQAKIDALEKENSDTQKELESLQSEIADKEKEQALLKEKRDNAEAQALLYSQKLAVLTEQISQNELAIEQKETDIVNHTELFGQRVRAMYLSSETSTLELLFQSTSFSEFLSRVETLRRISEYDNELIATLRQEKDDLGVMREELLAQQTDAELTRQNYQEKAKELQFSIDEVQLAQEELEAMEAEYQKDIKANQAAAAKFEQEVDELIRKHEEEERRKREEEERRRREEEERRRKEQQQNANSSSTETSTPIYTEMNFIWPTPSSARITSYFGPRYIFGENGNHGAIDVAAPKESAIVASKSGTVIAAGDSGTTYGIYVIISHGDGYSTLYAHCNSIDVSVGQSVTQGQRIAGVGSTGRSTGYHLHFEVRKNGVRVDPLDYVSAPW